MADKRDDFFRPPLGRTILGESDTAARGVREGPAARTEVALTCFHTACDTALVDSIVRDAFVYLLKMF